MGIVLEVCSQSVRDADTSVMQELREAPKCTRLTYPAPIRAQEYGDTIIGDLVEVVAGDVDFPTRSVVRAGSWVSRARPTEFDHAMGKTGGLPPTFAGGPQATCGEAKKQTPSGTHIRTLRSTEAGSSSECEKCCLVVKLSTDSPAIGAEDWLDCAHAMQTALVPNASPEAVASVGVYKQHYQLENSAENTIAAEDWSDATCTLLHRTGSS